MAIRGGLTRSALLEFLRGVHDEGDTYKLALIRSDVRGHFNESTWSYNQLGADEAIGEGYAPGGIELQDYFATFVGDEASIGWSPPEWPVATVSAAGALIYNASKENRVLQVLDFGGTVASTNGPFKVDVKRAGQIALRLAAN